jgi:hypothetical protein
MKYATDRHQPPGDWVGFTLATSVVGVSMSKPAARAFASAARLAERRGWAYGVTPQWEPNNPHDPNAIAVIGMAESRGCFGGRRLGEWKIGYLPREVAEEVVTTLAEPGFPVGLELYSIYEGREGYIDIKVVVLGPPGTSHSARRRAKRTPPE